ncbi:GNAT family N-acetyltransferase [Mucilaginibacter sp. Bleaf8]|uniref:GNAT family N-acetyltransferase n=1 Tax=Mucilaginibacter sp. Bleaf8 TaxID=2834430 RepID=UPI001BCC01E8|nr:GNAT family N-acetyltransferase [Mucilaginibacter sp. Bleaf8]MBS7565409.1 GNAT family N-acetyltransferase [Mucilaginibacter sp. Bleaf8]
MKTILTTPRIQVRQFAPNEAHLLQELNDDERTTRYTTPRSPEQLQELFAQIQLSYNDDTPFGRWGMFNPADNDFMGTCMLTAARPGMRGMETGYSLHVKYWGQGLATEVVQALVAYGFAHGLTEICAITDPENKASQRVLVKAGFTDEDTVFLFAKNLPLFKIRKGDG